MSNLQPEIRSTVFQYPQEGILGHKEKDLGTLISHLEDSHASSRWPFCPLFRAEVAAVTGMTCSLDAPALRLIYSSATRI